MESARRTLVHDEVLIVFTDPGSRDLVARHAVNLGNMRDQDGKPTAGIRMEVPDFLQGLGTAWTCAESATRPRVEEAHQIR